jgi:hypothetical protein
MKRRLSQLVLFLLLGAIVNVAVAWGLAFSSARRYENSVAWGVDACTTQYHCLRSVGCGHSLGAVIASSNWLKRTGQDLVLFGDPVDVLPRWFPLHGLAPGVQDGSIHSDSIFGVAHGLPIPCLYALRQVTVWPNYQKVALIGRAFELEASSPGQFATLLPVRPIWPGFAINTIFYAAALWVVFLIPGSVKRFRRRRRGLCIHCGYDLRGQPANSHKCPECGKSA